MRKLLILLFVPLFFACNSGPESGSVINGNIENLGAGSFQLGGPAGAKDPITVDEEGEFHY